MDIKRGKYMLCSDQACCWISEQKISKKTGQPYWECISGYYPNFRMLADVGLPSHLIRSSEAKSMRKLVEDVKKMEEKIAKMTTKKLESLTDDMGKPIP